MADDASISSDHDSDISFEDRGRLVPTGAVWDIDFDKSYAEMIDVEHMFGGHCHEVSNVTEESGKDAVPVFEGAGMDQSGKPSHDGWGFSSDSNSGSRASGSAADANSADGDAAGGIKKK